MIFSKELEKLAEEYATGNHRSSFADTFEKKAYIAGAAALENLIMKSESEFDLDKAELATDNDTNVQDFIEGARWQHRNDQLIIGGLRKRIECLEGIFEHMVECEQQLEAKLKELQK